MTVRNPTNYVITTADGATQLAQLTGKLTDAQETAERMASDRGQTVLLYGLMHLATISPPPVPKGPAQS